MNLMQSTKSALSRWGDGVYVPRRLPGALGGRWFPASTTAGAKVLRPHAERIDTILTDFARRFVRPDMSVWDVGANIGLFTWSSAGLTGTGGRVLAIEPDVVLASRLHASRRWNRGFQVSVLAAAISDRRGVASFDIARNGRATNHLSSVAGSPAAGGTRERSLVPVVTLDDLLLVQGPPDLVKIDVEGSEMAVLRGAGRTLASRPVLLVEVQPNHAKQVSDLLRAAGYRFLDGASHAPIERPSWNTIAVPANRLGSYT